MPFPGGSPLDKVLRHRSADPAPAPRVPEGLMAVVRRLMAKRPRDRFPTAGDAADALARFGSGGCPWEHAPLDLSGSSDSRRAG